MPLLRAAALAALTTTVVLATTACTDGDSPDGGPPGDGNRVVASTTLAGALAKAAGATDVTVIAPANIPDQQAFAPTTEDLVPARTADHVIFAETDGFAGSLKEAAGDAHQMAIKPVYTLEGVHAEVTKLAELFGTQNAAKKWLTAFDTEVTNLSASMEGVAPIPPFTAVAEVGVAQWAQFGGGIKVVGKYGPAPVTAKQLADLTATKPMLILANVHAPNGTPKIPGTYRVDLVNYPGEDLDLLSVYETNAERIGLSFSRA
jgi:zinc transport system substrate-binding protein